MVHSEPTRISYDSQTCMTDPHNANSGTWLPGIQANKNSIHIHYHGKLPGNRNIFAGKAKVGQDTEDKFDEQKEQTL